MICWQLLSACLLASCLEAAAGCLHACQLRVTVLTRTVRHVICGTNWQPCCFQDVTYLRHLATASSLCCFVRSHRSAVVFKALLICMGQCKAWLPNAPNAAQFCASFAIVTICRAHTMMGCRLSNLCQHRAAAPVSERDSQNLRLLSSYSYITRFRGTTLQRQLTTPYTDSAIITPASQELLPPQKPDRRQAAPTVAL